MASSKSVLAAHSNRRRFLAGLGAMTIAPQIGRALGAPTVDFPAASPTLRATAAQHGILAGCAVSLGALRNDPTYADLIRKQAGIVVAENAMKFAPLRPAPNKFFFGDADDFVSFAETNGIKVRGHNFVWHKQLPEWFQSYATQQNAQKLLVEHITEVGGRYAKRIHSWDVVNEAVHLEDGRSDGLRNSPWLKLLGPGYIETAFRTARSVDPNAMLVYNEFGIEADTHGDEAKRKAVLALLRYLKERNVPIDALGIQSHISVTPDFGYGSGLTELISEIRKMGMKVLITELDVNDRHLPADIGKRDKQVADLYGSYLHKALKDPATCAILTWGITDRYTWLNDTDSRTDGLKERCLPFDDQYKPKPAFEAELKALGEAARNS